MVPTKGASISALVATFVTLMIGAAPALALQAGGHANRPPTIEVSLPDRSTIFNGTELRFTVTITDPDGDPVDGRLVKGLGRMTMRPVLHEHSPAKRVIRCWPHSAEAGRQRLVFEANDTVDPARKVRKTLVLDLGNMFNPTSGVVIDDVDRDGRFELLAASEGATHSGIPGAGVVYRFDQSGSSIQTPSVRYESNSSTSMAFGGEAGQSILPWDFTGDGRPELTIAAPFEDKYTGRIFVFEPRISHGTPNALATLSDPNGMQGDEFGRSWSARGLFVGDVTGDGIDDLVVCCSSRSTPMMQYTGAVYVFAGGANWSGAMAPTATLLAPVLHAGDQLSYAGYNDSILLEDVTGDGVKDVVVSAPAYTTQSLYEGAVFVWEGGPGLRKRPAPIATLAIQNATPHDSLGYFGGAQGVRVEDVTGDGIRDVLAGATYFDDGLKADTGALFLWAGGPGLTGNPAPTATLKNSAASASDELGNFNYVDSLFLHDFSGDGILDVVTGSSFAIGGGGKAGAAGNLYVWNGGATLAGTVDPTATLYVSGAHPWDHLAYDNLLRYPTVRFADVSGDGRLDIVASAPSADSKGVRESGGLYVWNGRAGGFSGATAADAELYLATPRKDDELGSFGPGPGVDFADLSGDGVLDVVTGSKVRAYGAKPGVGAGYVFFGGPGLTGAHAPDAELQYSLASQSDMLERTSSCFADVNGDGIEDAIFISPAAKSPPYGHTGAAYVWFGGAALGGSKDPDVLLQAPMAVGASSFAEELRLADLTGDGLSDVLVGSPSANVGSVTNAGAWWIFAGGTAMSGAPQPVASLLAPNAQAGDRLGDAGAGLGLRLLDFDQDGDLDALITASNADIAANVDAGALYLWRGPFANGAGSATTFCEKGPTTSYLLGD